MTEKKETEKKHIGKKEGEKEEIIKSRRDYSEYSKKTPNETQSTGPRHTNKNSDKE
jgi:hypothetical protein